jgi:hypothetical protein
MEKTITRAIRFLDRKIVMKPIEGKGLVETWTTSPPIDEPIKQFIKYKGVFYYLVVSVDKSQPNPSL